MSVSREMTKTVDCCFEQLWACLSKAIQNSEFKKLGNKIFFNESEGKKPEINRKIN